MKLTRLTKLAMAAGLTVSVSLSACSGDDDTNQPVGGDGDTGADGGTTGDGDSGGDGGTGGDGDIGAGGAESTNSCDPGTTRCVGDRVVETCLGDGKTWFPSTCELGCENDSCVEPPQVCSPGDSMCTDAKTRVTCSSDGASYEEVTCPDSAPCVDGVCAGPVCNAGETRCRSELTAGTNWFEGYDPSALSVVETCVDGTAWVESPCDSGTVCTYDRVAPYDPAALIVEIVNFFDFPIGGPPDHPEILPGAIAACRATECLDSLGFGPRSKDARPQSFTCGDPTDPSVDSDRFYTQCSHIAPFGVPTWITQECTVGQCTGDREDPCDSDCIPGATRCEGDRALETCNARGDWDEPVVCMDGNAVSACAENPFLLPDGRTSASCVDPACHDVLERAWFEGYALDELGVCVNSTEIAFCNEAGELQAPVACRTGTCETFAEGLDGNSTGMCRSECTAGEQRCEADGVSTCGANGLWGDVVSCSSGLSCQTTSYTTRVCGECAPGETNCSGDQIEICGTNNMWTAAVDCDFGRCQSTSAAGETIDACRGDCSPGAVTCSGNLASQTCNANGLWEAAVSCTGDTRCVNNNSGDSLGCVECVSSAAGGNYYFDASDVSCSPTGELRVCGSDNTWQASTACDAGTACGEFFEGAGTVFESQDASCNPIVR